MLLTNPPPLDTEIKRSAFALPAASLTFKDVAFDLPPARRGLEPRPVLEPCSGHFEAGQLVAIMGPSGCGKTTLLDMLAMKKTARHRGEVRVNGRPRGALFRRIAAYAGQEDVMPPHWTVREAITFNATLKRQTRRAHHSVEAWIDVLLEAFSLGGVADVYVGGAEVRGISGGQRRRVTLARGVAAQASLLFCDEPTSGLSGTDAELCTRALRIVAKRLGVLCLVVIHQPRHEVSALFDSLVLLTSNPGRMVYCGPMAEAQGFWKARGYPVPVNINPTDYYLDTLTPGTQLDQSEELVEAFRQFQKPAIDAEVEAAMSLQGQSTKDMLTSEGEVTLRGPYAVSFCTQLAVLLRRKTKLTLRNRMALAMPLLVPVLQGLIVGYMFLGIGEHGTLLRQIMFAFCLLIMLCLAGSMNLLTPINERTLMKHEASEALYSEGACALALFLIEAPLAFLGAVLNISVMGLLARFEWSMFETVLHWALLLFFVYDSLFAFIGAVAADAKQAQAIASPVVGIFMMFNGFVVSKADSPAALHWIFAISPNSYAMEAIAVDMAEHFPLQGPLLLKKLGYDTSSRSAEQGWAVMLAMIAVLRLGQQLALRFLNDIKR